MNEKIILGIDPGTVVMGYGVIEVSGKGIKLICSGSIQLHLLESQAAKLHKIFERCCWMMEEYKPDELSIEAPFFGKNVQSMLKLGRAQGVAMAAALSKGIPVFEYSPRKIKQSIAGSGNASKEQVAAMLARLLQFSEMPRHLDATDALATAVCHYFQRIPKGRKKQHSGWKSFLTENPERKMVYASPKLR